MDDFVWLFFTGYLHFVRIGNYERPIMVVRWVVNLLFDNEI